MNSNDICPKCYMCRCERCREVCVCNNVVEEVSPKPAPAPVLVKRYYIKARNARLNDEQEYFVNDGVKFDSSISCPSLIPVKNCYRTEGEANSRAAYLRQYRDWDLRAHTVVVLPFFVDSNENHENLFHNAITGFNERHEPAPTTKKKKDLAAQERCIELEAIVARLTEHVTSLEAELADVKADKNFLHFDTYRSPGEGVNVSGSGCRVTYVPTGFSFSSHDKKTWIENKKRVTEMMDVYLSKYHPKHATS